MEDKKTTYSKKVYCKNCDFREAIEIQKGKEIEETVCPTCGTLKLMKDVDVVINVGNYYDNGFGL